MQIQLEHPGQSRWPLWATVIFLTALLARGIHLWQIAPAPFFPFKMGDAASYDLWAQRIAAGDWWGTEVFYQAPLYPYFLAVIYRLFGDDQFVVRLCQGIVGAMSCVALAAAGWRIFSGAVGVLAGLALALYAPALFFDLLLQKSVLDGFFCCSLLALYGVLLGTDRRSLWVLVGAATGFLTLTRENAIVLGTGVHVRFAVEPATALAPALWLLLGTALVLGPVALRNAAISGELHLTTSQFGPNFYIGNNPQADGTYQPLRPYRGSAKFEQSDAHELAEAAVGHPLSPAEVSRYWTAPSVAVHSAAAGELAPADGTQVGLYLDRGGTGRHRGHGDLCRMVGAVARDESVWHTWASCCPVLFGACGARGLTGGVWLPSIC